MSAVTKGDTSTISIIPSKPDPPLEADDAQWADACSASKVSASQRDSPIRTIHSSDRVRLMIRSIGTKITETSQTTIQSDPPGWVRCSGPIEREDR